MIFQMRREAQLIVNDNRCRADVRKVFAIPDDRELDSEELLDRLDQFTAKHKLENGFYDPELMRAIGCPLNLGLTVDVNHTASNYVKQFFTDQKQIGAPSVEGVAVMSGVKSAKDMFVIKAPRNPGNDNLIHEYFVGAGGVFSDAAGDPAIIIGCNWLRKFCLNYSQVLAAFQCGPPEIDPLSKRLRGWCDTTNPTSFVNYVLYEKIDGPDVEKICQTRRPTLYKFWELRDKPYDLLREAIVGWKFREVDIIPGGGADELKFDVEVAIDWIQDHPDVFVKVLEHVQESISSFIGTREESEKK